MGDHDTRDPEEPIPAAPVDFTHRRRREATAAFTKRIIEAVERGEPVDRSELLEELERIFPTPAAESSQTLDLKEALRHAMADVRARALGLVQPVPTPFPTLDEDLRGGFYVGNHIAVSATAMGKTILATDCAMTAARAGHVVAIAAIEMGADEQAVRLASEAAGLPFSVGMTDPTPAQADRFEAAAAEIEDLPILIDDMNPNGWSSDDLERLCCRAREMADGRETGGLTPLVIVDFLQIVGSRPRDREDTVERISKASYAARTYAKKYQVAVLIISSTARHGYNVTSGNPKALADQGVRLDLEVAMGAVVDRPARGASNLVGLGKGSGETEYSATTVMVLSKMPGDDDGSRAIILAKNRNARRETWIPMRFENAQWREATVAEAIAMVDTARALEPQKQASGEPSRGRQEAVGGALLEALSDGPLPKGEHRTRARTLLKRATGRGVSNAALDQARDELILDGEIVDLGGSRGHLYALPEQAGHPGEAAASHVETTPEEGVSRPCPDELAACPATSGKGKGSSLPPDRGGRPRRGPPRSGKQSPTVEKRTTPLDAEARRRQAILAELDRESPQSQRQLRKSQQIKGNAQAVAASVASLIDAGELENTAAGLVRSGGTHPGTEGGTHPGTLTPVRSENVPVRTTQNVPAKRTAPEVAS